MRNVQLQPKNGVFEVKGQFNNSSQGEQFVTYAPNTEELQRKLMIKRKVPKLSINQQKKQVLG